MRTGTRKYQEFKQTNSIKRFLLDRYNGKMTDSNGKLMISCPFHDDNNPSCYVTDKDWYCFSCGKSGDIFDLLCPMFNKTSSEIIEFTGDQVYTPIYNKVKDPYNKRDNNIKANVVRAAKKSLRCSKGKIDYLLSRGLTEESIEKSNIGYISYPSRNYTLPRYMIPIYDDNNELKTAIYRRDDTIDDSDKKYLYHPGCSPMLYGLANIRDHKVVVLTAGQFDAIILNQIGVPAVGSSGENIFKSEWAKYFAGKITLILYDNDDAGENGAERASSIIPNSVVVDWGPNFPKKYDVTDAYKEMGAQWIKDMLNQRYKKYTTG